MTDAPKKEAVEEGDNGNHEQYELENRRGFFSRNGLSLGSAALGSLLSQSMAVATPPLSAKKGHLPARAKSVIYLHMIGAPSQLDLFDPKPELVKRDNELCPESF